jgi:hypothetical protein
MFHDPKNRFVDVDNSEIIALGRDEITHCRRFTIQSPHADLRMRKDIRAVFFDRPAPAPAPAPASS